MCSNYTFKRVHGSEVTDAMLADTAALFSSAYGIWGPLASQKMGNFAKAGNRIKMSVPRLCEQSLSPSTDSELLLGLYDNKIAGYAFATRWQHGGHQICWVTQLCVSPEHRRKKLATKILLRLREGHNDHSFGILSSHPAAILGALRAWGSGIEKFDISMIRGDVHDVMVASPVNYVKAAKPAGSLFQEGREDDRVICCADTAFWVDHTEPLAVLAAFAERDIKWPFGELPEGYEYLVLINTAEVFTEG
ncbi:hypothetical protein OPT61_g1884 [Boeremia exigua]|uniref:Uncharacterized protein n=1 Tax=Boeremia exigua TaxID=749465 RepID=A0ACC2INH7_9PLEO|nr:hypothetical protein OPT61_g1884 [Boeremia exigua]